MTAHYVRAAVVGGIALFTLIIGCGTTTTTTTGGGTKAPPLPPPTIVLTLVGPYKASLAGDKWVVAGIPAFTLLATGTNFPSTSVIQWNGTPLLTEFGTSTGLAANISSALVSTPGTVSITVNDPVSGATSNALPFGIASPAAATAGVIQMVTAAPDGTSANADSLVAPSVSFTGRYVSFQSAATNLGAGVVSGYQQIYERDTCLGAPSGCTPSTIPISVTFDGSAVNGQSRTSSISADGRYVAFDSSATNILAHNTVCAGTSGTPNPSCTYLRDTCLGVAARCTPSTVSISAFTDGNAAGGQNPGISPDGRYVAFNSSAANISGQNPATEPNVFLRDTCNGAPAGCTPTTTPISQSADGMFGNQGSGNQATSSGGRFVAFESYATNLVPNDTNPYSDIFVRDTCLGASASCVPSIARASVSTGGTQGNNSLDYEVVPSISGDGRLVSWASDATDMVAQNVNGFANVYVRDTCSDAAAGCTPTTSLASVGNDGSIPNYGQNNQSMSADGRYIAFASLASNLVPGDTFAAGEWKDIFVRDTCFGAPPGCTPSTVRVSITSVPSFDTESNAINDFPQISGDGHYLAFLSAATNYVNSGGNGHVMVYLAKTGF